MTPIEFTDNYEDLSNAVGYQFRFYCPRCDADFTSEFQPVGPDAMEDNGLLAPVGHLLTREGPETAAEDDGPEHDAALRTAIAEVKEHFHQCPGCGEWVCDLCWNRALLMCEKCAPSEGAGLRHCVTEPSSDGSPLRARESVCPHCNMNTTSRSFCTCCGRPIRPQG